MILSSDDIRALISEYDMIAPAPSARTDYIEGCTWDLRLASVEKRDIMSNPPIITEAFRKIPKYTPHHQDEDGLWPLVPNSRYKLTSIEEVCMPNDVRGVVQLKRTLPECGLFCQTTGIAPGYQGSLSIIVYNTDLFPAYLGPRSLFATIEFHWISPGATDPYRGPRQGNKPLEGKVPPT